MPERIPSIVIVGGGFGGLAAAKAVRNTCARIVLIDRANHHLFQPLLYQVATSELAPGQIGSPIRGILRNQSNTTVILGEVSAVDKDRQCVFVAYCDLIASPRWKRIFNAGARPQRLLFASTGTKDPKASDVLYIKELAAPLTINTMPELRSRPRFLAR
jgi:NADPH-dependent 2,4-dienoyl-CoA reductase/sulfur reductase-like enzyme